MTETPEPPVTPDEKDLTRDCRATEEHPLVSDLLAEIGGKCPDAIKQEPAEKLKHTLEDITPKNTSKAKPKKRKR